ncbi:MAG: class I SAM-dependent methyltransferase [Candidatus Portnoybacteria bacterium]|nr:class I SAM-dependent methyltransferase [Candidatus Portnoybacteria bacterium]
MDKQVDKNHYEFRKYCDIERWSSYWHQIDEILKCQPQSVLEIGVGDRVLASYLKNNTDIQYASVDIDSALKPDVVCSVEYLKFKDDSFNLVCAFEVLEHLPFEKFELALLQLRRVSKKNVILSLPHWGRHFSIDIRLPLLKRLKWQNKFSVAAKPHKFSGQHYWEIGKKGYSLKNVKSVIKKAGFEILKDYIVFESPYHHFFVLEKIKQE